MFEAEVRSEVLLEVLNVVSTLVDEAKFIVNEAGITMKVVDPAHVAMAEVTLKKDAFESFNGPEGELGIDISKLMDVLKLAATGDIVKLIHDEEKTALIVKVNNITRQMLLVDTASMSDPKVPNLSLPAHVVLSANDLNQGIKASESVSDHISLTMTTDGFELNSKGDTDSVQLKLPKTHLKKLECKEKAKSMFSLNYFSNMIKSVNKKADIAISMGTDYPIKIEFPIAEGGGEVRYLLAPRIESD